MYVFLYEDGKVKEVKVMKTFVEVDFSVNYALCNIDIIPVTYKRDEYMKIVIGNDNLFTIEEKGLGNRQHLNPKGFAELLEICEKLNALKRSLPIELFVVKALSNEYTEKLVKAISVLADTHYIHIVGLDSVMRCDYIGVDVVRNNDKTLNIFIDVVKYNTDEEHNSVSSFDVRNGKMCRFFDYNDMKIPVEIYHALNAIASVESSFSDEQIISEIGEALKKVAGAYDVSVRKDPNNPNTMLPFPFVLPNTNL